MKEIFVSGRTELAGNHTDHQNGRILAAAIDLGVTARYGYNKAAVMVTRLSTGEPVSGADVSVYAAPSNWSNRSDSDNDIVGLKDFTQLGSTVKTDADGFALISYSSIPKNPGYYWYIEAKTKDKDFNSFVKYFVKKP